MERGKVHELFRPLHGIRHVFGKSYAHKSCVEVVELGVQVVLEEGHKRKIIFSTFDPDCATLLSLKCARYGPVLFLSSSTPSTTE